MHSPCRCLMICSIVAVCLAFSAPVMAELKPGDLFPMIEAEDQHGKPYAVTGDTKFVAVSLAMGTGKKANRFFTEKGAQFLPEQQAVFIADIHGMPGIGRRFALPKMRKYAHRVLLADEKGLLDDIPSQKGKVTVFRIDEAGVIGEIGFWDPTDGKSPF